MATSTGLVAIATVEQWEDCVASDVVVDRSAGVIELAWELPKELPSGAPPAPEGLAGLAIDAACWTYHAVPEEGRVERGRWQRASRDPLAVSDLLAPEPPVTGAFRPQAASAGGVVSPAMAADRAGRLFVVDDASAAVLVIDVADRHLIQRVRFPARPLDVSAVDDDVYVLCDDATRPLWRLRARREPVSIEVIAARQHAPLRRLAVTPATGEAWALAVDGGGVATAVSLRSGATLPPVPGGRDIEIDGNGAVAVAAGAGDVLRRFVPGGDDPELRPLVARHYDGRGIVRMPSGRIGFWTRRGLREAVTSAVRHHTSGTIDTGPLDAGAYRQGWGRVFVDACVPEGASLRIAAYASDDAVTPPEPLRAGRHDAPLHCRATGSDLPWHGADERFETYEAPVMGPPGRYLWVRLVLGGTASASPRVRALRAEYPGHDLLRRLPRVYSRDEESAAFLDRYLGIIASVLGDMARRADERHVLLDPAASPDAVLPWLAGLVGLTLDERWSDEARRTMLAEAVCLFRKRGTPAGLTRMLRIYLGVEPVIVESYRVRGQGTGTVGDNPWSRAIVGGGFRVGGAVGSQDSRPIAGRPVSSFDASAHRFSVVVRRHLDAEQERTVRDMLDMHRPAHTDYELCTVGSGMRIGRGLYVELTSIVGPGAGFDELRVGDPLGHDAVLGRPRDGLRPEASRIGRDTRLGG